MVGAARRDMLPPADMVSRSWYAHCWPSSSGGVPPDGGDATSAEKRDPVEDSATRERPNPMPVFFLELGFDLSVEGRYEAGETSENIYVSPINGFKTPRAVSIILALFEEETPVEYATPLIFFIRPGLRKCIVFGSRIWCPKTSWTSPAPPFPPAPRPDLRSIRSSMLFEIPKFAYSGRIAVRTLSADISPAGVAEVTTPGPENSTFIGAFENGARRHSGIRK